MLLSNHRVENPVKVIHEAQNEETVFEDLLFQELLCWGHSSEHVNREVIEVVSKRELRLFDGYLYVDLVYICRLELIEGFDWHAF